MYSCKQLLLSVALLVLQIVFAKCDEVVNIQQGTLRGYERTDRNGGKFFAFRSIPYAKPPIENLRFQPPVPHGGWSGIYNATEDLPICYQGTGQEDCLYLSVYTKNTQVESRNDSQLKPVMVFFHGGGYVSMSPQEDFYNPEYLLTKDIVLVTAGYRLGFLGFVNLGADTSNFVIANAGMKDQVEVLSWVQRNIEYFGGNKNSVTIFGESAGAASVHLHMFSPLSKGLFHKAILESGSAMHYWSIGRAGSGEALAKALKIPTANLTNTLEQLQHSNVSEIFSIQNDLGSTGSASTQALTSPIVEGNIPGAFLPTHPVDLLKSGNYSHVPMIIGYNTQEGIYLDIANKLTGSFLIFYNLTYLVPLDLNITEEGEINEVANEMEQFYFDGQTPIPEVDALKLVDVVTDVLFAYGIVQAVRSHYIQGDRIYLYEFGASTKLNFYKRLHPVTALYEGASHMDELGYLFKNEASPSVEANSVEDRMIEKMVAMWVNFASSGNPTPSGSDIHWNPVSIDNRSLNYFRIRNDEFTNEVNPLNSRTTFWDRMHEIHGV